MLLHVTHKHSYKTCPLSDGDPANTLERLNQIMCGADGVRVIGTWMNGPAHEGYMVLDVDDFVDAHRLLAPMAALGEVITVPVTEFQSLQNLIT
ncbi:MAG TPA: hypothetical protein EYQ00_04330 [Dehalococcoidia bacterium]|nr:hypothetical protein [Dehalococcoidia bacterium]